LQNIDIALGYLLKALLLPPCGNLLLLMIGWWVRRRRALAGTWIIRIALGSLAILTLPLTGLLLASPLESAPAFDPARGPDGAAAIVILGGGVYPWAPEYAGETTVHPRTLERLRYGAYLYQTLGLPVALIGGSLIEGTDPEGILMFNVINGFFNVPVNWIETGSHNTAENAAFSRKLIPVKRILLVTHALHMPRARMMFEANGFEVIPAPLGFRANFDVTQMTLFDLIPAVDALDLAHDALHEYLGLLWYRWHYPTRASH
jgi:uncharacterized SAM-binding protein YcdF (DUF218 family)